MVPMVGEAANTIDGIVKAVKATVSEKIDNQRISL